MPQRALIMVAYVSIFRGRILFVVGLITLVLLAFVGLLLLAFGVQPLSVIPLALLGLTVVLWVITIFVLRGAGSGLPALPVSHSCSSGEHGGCSETTEPGGA